MVQVLVTITYNERHKIKDGFILHDKMASMYKQLLFNEKVHGQKVVHTILVINQLTKNSCKCSDGGSHVPRSVTV